MNKERISLENYIENNIYCKYLYDYYEYKDISSIFGIEKMEIKHSNFLKWLFSINNNNNVLEHYPIIGLINIIKKETEKKDIAFLNELNLNNISITDVEVEREYKYIDILIKATINNEKVLFVIENKLETATHETEVTDNGKTKCKNQLDRYKETVEVEFRDYKEKYFLHLSPGKSCNIDDMKLAKEKKYLPITYQEIYNYILKDMERLTLNTEYRFLISNYIHSLALYSSDEIIGGLITTEEEQNSIEKLFRQDKSKKINEFQKAISNEINKGESKYLDFIRCILKKYESFSPENYSKLDSQIRVFMSSYPYNFRYIGSKKVEGFRSVGKLLNRYFEILLVENNMEYEKLEKLNYNKESEEDYPLIIKTDELINISHRQWYEPYKGDYMILTAWNRNEYKQLVKRLNDLRKLGKPYNQIELLDNSKLKNKNKD